MLTLPLAALMLASCGITRAVGVPRLSPDQTELDFGEVRHAASHERILILRNSGTASARAVLAVTEPFRIGADALTIEPDGRGEVPIFFLPSDYEDAEGELIVRVEGQDQRIRLTAAVDEDFDEDGHTAIGAGGEDCDDLDPLVGPGRPEICNGIDDDCDGTIDQDAEDATPFYADRDGDGFGDDDAQVTACEAPPGHVAMGGDCDDGDRFFRPGAAERSDGLDQDCDGRVDEHLMTAGALVVVEIHPGQEPDVPPYLELGLGDPPAPLYLEGLEVEVDGREVVLIGTGVGYRASSAPILLLCGQDAPGRVDGLDCVGRLPAGLTSGSAIELRAESTVDQVDTDGFRFLAGASLELGPELDAEDNDRAESWCVSTTPLASGLGSPGTREPHCEDDAD